MQFDKHTIKKLALLIGGGILFAWSLQNFNIIVSGFNFIRGLLAPFIIGLIIAYIINIPMVAFEKHVFKNRGGKAKRPLCFILTLISVFTLLSLIVFLVVPELAQTIKMLVQSMPEYISRLQENLQVYEEYLPQLEKLLDGLKLDWSDLSAKVISIASSGVGNVFGFASSFISGITSFIIGFIFACYLLLDKEHLLAQTQGLMQAYIPEKPYASIMNVLKLANRIFSRFISGQCTEALVITLMFFIVLSVGQFDYALLISVLVGVFSFIPVFGAFIACGIGAFLLLVSMGFWRALIFIAVFLVVQQLDGNFVYPRIIGSSISLPPIWVLVAVSVGGGLMGMFGMLLFIPLTSLIYALVHRHASERLKKKGIESPTLALKQNAPLSRKHGKHSKQVSAAKNVLPSTDSPSSNAKAKPSAKPKKPPKK